MALFKNFMLKHQKQRTPFAGEIAQTTLHKNLEFTATEQYKLLRTNLDFTLPEGVKCPVIGVTSSMRGEGKSTTAVNLSYVLAEKGSKVLLIDGDLRIPSVAKKMGIQSSPGLTDVLMGKNSHSIKEFKSSILDTWYIMPSGDIPPNPSELLGSKRMATALEQLATTGEMKWDALTAFLGFIPGSFGETSTLAILIGAAILLITGVASWKTMVSVFVGGAATAYLFSALGSFDYPAYYHLIVGGFAFGAVFMATDPVTSAQTSTGKYIVGFLTGAIAILIRQVNPAYPEGMMLSILFMNALAPLVDYFVVEANIRRRQNRVKTVK